MDPTLDRYEQLYPGMVVKFSKRDAWAITDDADNSGSMAGVVYARNMIWQIAADLGVKHFIMLDDDYTYFSLRFGERFKYESLRFHFDHVIPEMIRWLESDPRILSVAMSQGGDHIGGAGGSRNKDGPSASRKVMNTFVCSTDRPFRFFGRLNEDTTAYVVHGNRGHLFFTTQHLQVNQVETQQNSGGLTEIYEDLGTYYKSFLSVMYAPSCVKVSAMASPRSGTGSTTLWNGETPYHASSRIAFARPKGLRR